MKILELIVTAIVMVFLGLVLVLGSIATVDAIVNLLK